MQLHLRGVEGEGKGEPRRFESGQSVKDRAACTCSVIASE